MSNSILDSTKRVLLIAENYHAFDDNVEMFINGAFSTIQQLGVGPENGFMISGPSATWDEFEVAPVVLAMVKNFVFLHVKMLFDPPQTGYLNDALKAQLDELQFRLNNFREIAGEAEWPPDTSDNWVILDGGTN